MEIIKRDIGNFAQGVEAACRIAIMKSDTNAVLPLATWTWCSGQMLPASDPISQSLAGRQLKNRLTNNGQTLLPVTSNCKKIK
jgi:hypothetical protein